MIRLIDYIDDTRTTFKNCLRNRLSSSFEEIAVAVFHNRRIYKLDEFIDAIHILCYDATFDDRVIFFPWDVDDNNDHDG